MLKVWPTLKISSIRRLESNQLVSGVPLCVTRTNRLILLCYASEVRQTVPLKLRRCRALFLPVCITPRRQRCANPFLNSCSSTSTLWRQYRHKRYYNFKKLKSTAGRGEPSASTRLCQQLPRRNRVCCRRQTPTASEDRMKSIR